MDLNEIKKSLYRQKPDAIFTHITNGNNVETSKKYFAHYYCDLDTERIKFVVPVEDMGDAEFKSTMDSKLMIRWIKVETKIEEV